LSLCAPSDASCGDLARRFLAKLLKELERFNKERTAAYIVAAAQLKAGVKRRRSEALRA